MIKRLKAQDIFSLNRLTSTINPSENSTRKTTMKISTNMLSTQERTTLEEKIDRVIQKRREEMEWPDVLLYFERMNFDNITLQDVYGYYGYDDYTGQRVLKTATSEILEGELERARRQMSKYAKRVKFYEKNWPRIQRDLEKILASKHDDLLKLGLKEAPYIPETELPFYCKLSSCFSFLYRLSTMKGFQGNPWEWWIDSVDCLRQDIEESLRGFMYFRDTLTRKQLEKFTAAYIALYSEAKERQIAEEPDSLFPNITRKTLRAWIKHVQRFDETLGE